MSDGVSGEDSLHKMKTEAGVCSSEAAARLKKEEKRIPLTEYEIHPRCSLRAKLGLLHGVV